MRKGALQIRLANSNDARALSRLLAELSFPTSARNVAFRLKALDEDALVAVVNDAVVGLATTNIMRVLHRPKPVGRISALVVSECHRGNGVGRALVSAAERMLKRRGCGLVEVTSNMRLKRAHRFYKSIGYERTSYRFKRDVHDA